MSARDLLARATKRTTWLELGDGRWKCIVPERATGPGKGIGRTPLEALARALDGL